MCEWCLKHKETGAEHYCYICSANDRGDIFFFFPIICLEFHLVIIEVCSSGLGKALSQVYAELRFLLSFII